MESTQGRHLVEVGSWDLLVEHVSRLNKEHRYCFYYTSLLNSRPHTGNIVTLITTKEQQQLLLNIIYYQLSDVVN
jgi:hypothetical protein